MSLLLNSLLLVTFFAVLALGTKEIDKEEIKDKSASKPEEVEEEKPKLEKPRSGKKLWAIVKNNLTKLIENNKQKLHTSSENTENLKTFGDFKDSNAAEKLKKQETEEN
uniref:Uncharacterized protein n=1 Tax=Ditylenchus dipsaci TaxID=166011 RepID=A0A915D1X1_9BILA